jgi:hypothetical protein
VIRISESPTTADRHEARVPDLREDHDLHSLLRASARLHTRAGAPATPIPAEFMPQPPLTPPQEIHSDLSTHVWWPNVALQHAVAVVLRAALFVAAALYVPILDLLPPSPKLGAAVRGGPVQRTPAGHPRQALRTPRRYQRYPGCSTVPDMATARMNSGRMHALLRGRRQGSFPRRRMARRAGALPPGGHFRARVSSRARPARADVLRRRARRGQILLRLVRRVGRGPACRLQPLAARHQGTRVTKGHQCAGCRRREGFLGVHQARSGTRAPAESRVAGRPGWPSASAEHASSGLSGTRSTPNGCGASSTSFSGG